jgi:hypothetical protein
VRGLLDFLSGLASEQDTALLLVHHLNKPGARSRRRTLADFFGSFYIPAMARSVIGLTAESESRRRLEVIKSNISANPPPLAIELKSAGGQGVRLDWRPWTESQPAAPFPPASSTLLQEYQAWLLDLLDRSGQPLRPSEIVSLAARRGYNRCMVYRARRRLASAILDSHGRQHPRNAWQKKPRP